MALLLPPLLRMLRWFSPLFTLGLAIWHRPAPYAHSASAYTAMAAPDTLRALCVRLPRLLHTFAHHHPSRVPGLPGTHSLNPPLRHGLLPSPNTVTPPVPPCDPCTHAQTEAALRAAQHAGVRVLSHTIVYHLMDAVRKEMEAAVAAAAAGEAGGGGGGAPLGVVGEAEVLATFALSVRKGAVQQGAEPKIAGGCRSGMGVGAAGHGAQGCRCAWRVVVEGLGYLMGAGGYLMGAGGAMGPVSRARSQRWQLGVEGRGGYGGLGARQ